MNVICFGDSNTYGYDPHGYFGGRYDGDSRWVDILAMETGWSISNMGQNGREIPSAALAFPADTDLLIVMLGTNDLKPRFSLNAFDIAAGLERLVRIIQTHLPTAQRRPPEILLVCPPPVGEWVDRGSIAGMFTGAHSVAVSRELPRQVEKIARQYGCRFCDAGDAAQLSPVDGVHLTAQGHRNLAELLAPVIRACFPA